MTDVSFFWIAFGAYLGGMFALAAAALRRGGGGAARLGLGLMWIGALSQTVSIVWRSFLLGTEPLHQFFPRLRAAFSEGPSWRVWVYGLVFALPLATVVVGVVFRRRRVVWLLTAGVAVMLEMILLDFLDFARLPMEKVYEYLSIASWSAALALLAVSPVIRLVVIDAALAVMTALLVVFAAIHPHDIELQLVPALQSYWLFIHVSLTSIGFAIFGIAYIVAAMLLVKGHDRAAVSGVTRKRSWLALAVALAIGVAAVVAFARSDLILPRDSVAYAAHELAAVKSGQADSLPAFGIVQWVRYGGALLGAVGTVAYVAYWIAAALLRPKADKSGLASYQFVITSTAMLAACLLLAGFTRRQEKGIADLFEQRKALVLLHRKVGGGEGKLTGSALNEEIEQMQGVAAQARLILGKATWLPLTFDNQTRVAEDETYKELQSLYTNAAAYQEWEDRWRPEWKLPIRYKDIKQIGKILGKWAAVARRAKGRLDLPADFEAVARAVKALEEEGRRREERALLPRTKEGQLGGFVGLALIIAVPLAVAFGLVARRLRDRLPEPARLDRISYTAVVVGYPIFTFGAIFAGAIWAHFAWGTWWGWDPKEVGSLVAWVLYTIYLHQRYREGLSPRMAAVAAMLGFLAAVLSLAGNTFLGGLHAYS